MKTLKERKREMEEDMRGWKSFSVHGSEEYKSNAQIQSNPNQNFSDFHRKKRQIQKKLDSQNNSEQEKYCSSYPSYRTSS